MRFAYFTHSLVSCWNHGNAHFLRGVLRELRAAGHAVQVFEPANGWSRMNLVRDHGEAALHAFTNAFPELSSTTYDPDIDLEAAVDGCDVVIVHEWTDPAIVAGLGRVRRRGRFVLLFHDTHHRAVSEPAAMRAVDLAAYDGVLAFGEALADVYERWGWRGRVFVWHEAADIRLFRPPIDATERAGLVWIGNWGDGERSEELHEYLLRPSRTLGATLDVYGVRYPEAALAALRAHGGAYRGWLPNARVPGIFARHAATVHVPRRFYAKVLRGIPTIRVFEALACGIPLVSAPWEDSEGLFRPGDDFLLARSEADMARHLRALLHDPAMRTELSGRGVAAIRRRHTCAHRATELVALVGRFRSFTERRIA